MTGTVGRWARPVASVLTLGLLVWRLGAGPFLDGLRMVDGRALAAASAIAVLTTLCCAWRWKTVAGGLGVGISLPGAVAAYYRSQFLNLTLPGGVIGDVHRGVAHGRAAGDVGRGLRAVVLERFAGQTMQLLITLVVLLWLPSPVHSYMPVAVGGVVGLAVAAVLVIRLRRPGAGTRWARVRGAAARDIRDGLFHGRAWVGIALASGLVVAGHALTFLIAARTAGTPASPVQVLPVALLAMMVMVLPSAGGWGPREGMTAWAFGAAGLGAGRGVTTGVVYGILVLVASLPGAVVLVATWCRRTRAPKLEGVALHERAVHA